ncbi:MAG: hypothetical protein U0517_02450 [Candidatus Andersenbacteria bacterium]
MIKSLYETLKRSYVARICTIYFVAIAIWWVTIHIRGVENGVEILFLTLLYPLIVGPGLVCGLMIAKKWGGRKSQLGRALLFLTIGFGFQLIGQAVYEYYVYVKNITTPYPSWGDVGYFGTVILYMLGAIALAKAMRNELSLRFFKGKTLAVVIPLIMLSITTIFFLRGYTPDWSQPLRTFLDLGYPIGDAIYVSAALLVFALSRNFLGGIIRAPILFLIFALIMQYCTDFAFLYQAGRGTYYVAGSVDFLCFFAYFVMTLALLQLGVALQRFKEVK